MYLTDLFKTLKLAHYLMNQGLLFPIVYHIQKFQERQNYPFELRDKRIVKQSVFKGLCELAAAGKVKFKNKKELMADVNTLAEMICEPDKEKPKAFEKKSSKESEEMLNQFLSQLKKQPLSKPKE